jgi:hypothetical protein
LSRQQGRGKDKGQEAADGAQVRPVGGLAHGKFPAVRRGWLWGEF